MVCNPCIVEGAQCQARGENQKWLPHSCLLGGLAEVLCNPYVLGGPQCQAWGDNQKWLPHPFLLGGAQEGGSAT